MTAHAAAVSHAGLRISRIRPSTRRRAGAAIAVSLVNSAASSAAPAHGDSCDSGCGWRSPLPERSGRTWSSARPGVPRARRRPLPRRGRPGTTRRRRVLGHATALSHWRGGRPGTHSRRAGRRSARAVRRPLPATIARSARQTTNSEGRKSSLQTVKPPRTRGFDEHEIIGEKTREEHRPVEQQCCPDEADSCEKGGRRLLRRPFGRCRLTQRRSAVMPGRSARNEEDGSGLDVMTTSAGGVKVVERDPQQDVGGRRPAEGSRDAPRRGPSARRHPSSWALGLAARAAESGWGCQAACPSRDRWSGPVAAAAGTSALEARLGPVDRHAVPRQRGTADRPSGSPPASRPRRKGRRSASDRSSTRTMCGVSVRTMSDSCTSLRLLANSRPISGRSLRPGMPGHHRALFVADQAGEHVGLAVLEPDRRGDLAIAEGRQPVAACPRCCSASPSAPATPRRRDASAA